MDTDGKGFFSSWFDFRIDLKTDEFKKEFDEVIGALRTGKGGDTFLRDRTDLAKYCWSHPETGISEREYGVRADTESYSYLMRLNPNRGEYNLYCYCYSREALDRHLKEAEKGIRFIDSGYRELFRIPDGGKIRITYPGGETREETCRYIDPYHTEIGYGSVNLFHIAEFAERMEKSGAKIGPAENADRKREERGKTEHVIWDSTQDFEEWREDLEAELPDATREERERFMEDANRDLLHFIKEELSAGYPNGILVAADLGLWNGRHTAFRELEGGKLSDCFEPGRDTLRIKWYLDPAGDLRAEDHHHDGVNRYLYRAWKDGVTEAEKGKLRERILAGTAGKGEIAALTDRLGDEIGRVYGWTFPERKAAARGR